MQELPTRSIHANPHVFVCDARLAPVSSKWGVGEAGLRLLPWSSENHRFVPATASGGGS